MVKEKILQILPATDWNAVMLIEEHPGYFLAPIVVWALREVADDEVRDEHLTEVVGMTGGDLILPAESAGNFFLYYPGDQVTPEIAKKWEQGSLDYWQKQKAEKHFIPENQHRQSTGDCQEKKKLKPTSQEAHP